MVGHVESWQLHHRAKRCSIDRVVHVNDSPPAMQVYTLAKDLVAGVLVSRGIVYRPMMGVVLIGLCMRLMPLQV